MPEVVDGYAGRRQDYDRTTPRGVLRIHLGLGLRNGVSIIQQSKRVSGVRPGLEGVLNPRDATATRSLKA
jgi:hypothetical protein